MVLEQRQATDQWREARNRVIIRPKYVKLVFNAVPKAGWQKKDEQITLGQLDATRKNEPGSKAHTCYKVNAQYTRHGGIKCGR